MTETHDNLLQNRVNVTRREPAKRWPTIDVGQLWQYRDLLVLFIWRDFNARYRQSIGGVAWAVFTPLITMVVYSIFFGGLLGVPSDDIPYPVFAYAGLLPWELFAFGANRIAQSFDANRQLMSKIYFPRLIIPLSQLIFGLINFGISFIILLVMMLAFGYIPTLTIIFVPLFLLLALLASFSVGLLFATASVQFRDATHILGFGVTIMMYATPVVYPVTLLGDQWRILYNLNPMVGVVEGFRWALLGSSAAPGLEIFTGLFVTIVILIVSLTYFAYTEQFFADL